MEISFLFASTCAIAAYLIRKSLLSTRETKLASPTKPDFVDEEWTGLERADKQALALKLILA